MEASLRFYTNPQSRGQIVRWMLEEVAAPYETEIIQYGEQMKSEPYTRINPLGKVPAIVHNTRVVTECAAICAYLADAFPEARLAPESKERADYYRWLFIAAGPIEAAITNQNLGVVVPEDKVGMVGYSKIELLASALEKHLEDKDFITGSQFTAADVYVGSEIGFGLQFKTIPSTPGLESYWKRISNREACQRAIAIDKALL